MTLLVRLHVFLLFALFAGCENSPPGDGTSAPSETAPPAQKQKSGDTARASATPGNEASDGATRGYLAGLPSLPSDARVVVERYDCRRHCRDFRLEVDAIGIVTFRARVDGEFVENGRTIPPQKVEEFFRHAGELRFFELSNEGLRDCGFVAISHGPAGFPPVTRGKRQIEIVAQGRHHSLTVDGGTCDTEQRRSLERLIDEVTGAAVPAEWIDGGVEGE